MCIEDDATKNEERQKRARYHSAILDANTLLPRQDFKDLPETYVIFITEHDIFRCGFPLYHINRKIEENGMSRKPYGLLHEFLFHKNSQLYMTLDKISL